MDLTGRFGEFAIIFVLILVFFGSKEIPRLIREGARLMAKVRMYSDRVRRELESVTETVTRSIPTDITAAATAAAGTAAAAATPATETKTPAQELREKFLAKRSALTPEERAEKSALIRKHLLDSEQLKNAGAVMMYVEMGNEVETRETIRELLRMGKRVVIPYCKPGMTNLGIGEIKDVENDVIIGTENTPEPKPELRNRFFRSDLGLIVCPGVAFDHTGVRLGRGKGYYDHFLRELKGNIPIFGLAFDCQVTEENLPFSYFDISMDEIITERGFRSTLGSSSSAAAGGYPGFPAS